METLSQIIDDVSFVEPNVCISFLTEKPWLKSLSASMEYQEENEIIRKLFSVLNDLITILIVS